jgi:hypothetical protein
MLGISMVACKGARSTPAQFDVDADPVALLPAGPMGVVSLDARAALSTPLGPELAQIAAANDPLGDESGLRPTDDVDRVVVGLYGGASVEWVVVLQGRFDPARLQGAAHGKNGAPVVAGTYAGFSTRTVGPTTYVPLTQRTLVAGSADGMRRLLDRLGDGHPDRRLPPWMNETLVTPGAQVVAVVDVQSQPVASAALATLDLPWIRRMQVARVIANFRAPGMNVAGTLTYASEAEAASAADGVRSLGGWIRTLGPLLGGVQLQGLTAQAQGSDLRCAFALDDRTLRALAALAPRLLPTLAP